MLEVQTSFRFSCHKSGERKIGNMKGLLEKNFSRKNGSTKHLINGYAPIMENCPTLRNRPALFVDLFSSPSKSRFTL